MPSGQGRLGAPILSALLANENVGETLDILLLSNAKYLCCCSQAEQATREKKRYREIEPDEFKGESAEVLVM